MGMVGNNRIFMSIVDRFYYKENVMIVREHIVC